MNRTLDQTITLAREYLDPADVDCVVYHNPCNDGSGAAVAAWLAIGDNATYIKRAYHKPFDISALNGKNVVVLDASFKKDEFLELRKIANKIMIVDHHDSAMQNLSDVEGCFFTMENSGAILAWHYFHGLDTTAPQLLRLIEDRDLWRWTYRNLSEPLYYGLRELAPSTDFKAFLPYVDQSKLDDLIAYGQTLIAENHKWCVEAAKFAQHKKMQLPNDPHIYKILCSEIANDRLVSELSEYLYTLHNVDFVMLWSKTGNEQYKISFRSNNPNINLGAIATTLGGGGHKQAAGAVLEISPWSLVK